MIDQYRAGWDTLVGLFDLYVGLITGTLKGIWGFVSSEFQRVVDQYRAGWDDLVGLFDSGVASVMEYIDNIKDAWDGLVEKFDPVVVGFRNAWDSIKKIFDDGMALVTETIEKVSAIIPDWFTDGLGIGSEDPGVQTQARGRGRDGRDGLEGITAGRTEVGGEVVVSFENVPRGTSFRRVTSKNPDVPIDVNAGYSMGY